MNTRTGYMKLHVIGFEWLKVVVAYVRWKCDSLMCGEGGIVGVRLRIILNVKRFGNCDLSFTSFIP